jgi:hypothetical protein
MSSFILLILITYRRLARDYGEQAADGTDMKPADHAN